MPRALITGIYGFIGSHLADHLVAEGWQVDGIDDGSVGRAENVRQLNGRLGLHEGNVRQVLRELRVRHVEPYDTIFHLAGRVGVGQILADPLRMLTEHAEDAKAVLTAAELWKARVLLASSSEVYGTGTQLYEDQPLLIGPSRWARAGYAVSKLYIEHLALAYHRQKDVRAVVVRFFNIIGPRQRADGGVLPIFARAALSGEPILVHEHGAQRRCFADVREMVPLVAALALSDAAVGTVVNVGAVGPVLNMEELARRVSHYVRSARYVDEVTIMATASELLDQHALIPMMDVRTPNLARLQSLTGARVTTDVDAVVRDVCDEWALRLGVEKKEQAA